MMRASKTKGRQRVPMVKMNRQSNLQVTFSKRRAGLFKKASELCTLCDADVALVVFSPADKAFSFGHPALHSVVHRYRSAGGRVRLADHSSDATLRDLNAQLTEVANQLEAARKRGEDIAAATSDEREGRWWHDPVEHMEKQQLEQLSTCLDDLKRKIEAHADRAWVTPNLAQYLGPTAHFNPDDEFEQKSVLGGAAAPSMFPMMGNPSVGMVTGGVIVPGHSGFYGPQFNKYGLGFF